MFAFVRRMWEVWCAVVSPECLYACLWFPENPLLFNYSCLKYAHMHEAICEEDQLSEDVQLEEYF